MRDVAQQSALVSPVEAALDHYVKRQEEMELERPSDDDRVQSPHQLQQQQPATQAGVSGSVPAVKTPTHPAVEKSSSADAADYKFRVQKIVARPAAK